MSRRASASHRSKPVMASRRLHPDSTTWLFAWGEVRCLQLSAYVSLINSDFGVGGKTVHQILWAEQRSRHAAANLPKTLDEIRLSNVDALTEAELADRRAKLAALGELNQAIVTVHGAVERHPWHGAGAAELNLFDQEDLISHGERLKAALNAVPEALLALAAELGIEIADDLATAEKVKTELDRLPAPAPEVDKHLLTAMADRETSQALNELLGCIELRPGAAGQCISATLHGDLAQILALCAGPGQKQKLPKAGASGSQLSVVAGARSHLYRTRFHYGRESQK
ncbi:MAG: hypothetical protein JJE37_12760 [Methyloceanibacter sp.]|nr:hypothetical protein [Methyloceanibacter sp.]